LGPHEAGHHISVFAIIIRALLLMCRINFWCIFWGSISSCGILISVGREKIFFPKEQSLNLIFQWLLRKHIAFTIFSFSSVVNYLMPTNVAW